MNDKILLYFKKHVKTLTKVNPNLIGELLGSGVEGNVYQYGKNKILKLITFTHDHLGEFDYKLLMEALCEKNLELYTKVYYYGSFNYNYKLVHYYIADKCQHEPDPYDPDCVEFFNTSRSTLNKYNLDYDDFTEHNVMLKDGDYKIVDLTSFSLY